MCTKWASKCTTTVFSRQWHCTKKTDTDTWIKWTKETILTELFKIYLSTHHTTMPRLIYVHILCKKCHVESIAVTFVHAFVKKLHNWQEKNSVQLQQKRALVKYAKRIEKSICTFMRNHRQRRWGWKKLKSSKFSFQPCYKIPPDDYPLKSAKNERNHKNQPTVHFLSNSADKNKQ